MRKRRGLLHLNILKTQKESPGITIIKSKSQITAEVSGYQDFGVISSKPPINGLNGSGIMTEPSCCWKFSSIHTIIQGIAHAIAFKV